MPENIIIHRRPNGFRLELHLAGEAVSWLDIPVYRLHLGLARFSLGGLAGVATKPEHRMKGYSRRLLAHAVKLMTDEGLDLTMLFGIGDYYEKFDYAQALSEYEISLPGRAVADFKANLRARPLDKSEYPLTLPLHRRFASTRTLTLDRTTAHWPGIFLGSNWTLKSVATAFFRGKKLAGYLLTDDKPDSVRVIEAAFDSPATLESILAWLGQECRRKVVETIYFDLPPDHPLSRRLITLDAYFTRRTQRTGNGMMRILNLGSALSALLPELSARWSRSCFSSSALDLTLQTDLGPAQLLLPGRSSAAPLSGRITIPQRRLTQLLSGYRSVADISSDPAVRIPAKLLAPLAALFPELHPHILKADRF
jgi:predicted acetyltransferase